MPISVDCSCGKTYRVKETLAGKKIRCSDCSEVIKVPAAEDDDNPVFDEYDTSSSAADDEEESAPALPPRVKRKAKPAQREVEADESPRRQHLQKGWFESTNGGVLGGILMIIIAVVWFVGGLAGGVIFFYPPILLIIGIVAVIKGLFSSE